MDALLVTYFDETEELLQRAEECLIQLESGHSADEINELFRIAHSIKGSSQMVGYDKIGNLTHRIEDLLDLVRKGRVNLDDRVLKHCFDGMDCVKTMIEFKKAMVDEPAEMEAIQAAEKVKADIETILARNSGETGKRERERAASPGGIVQAMKHAKTSGQHRVYVSIQFSDDVPMVQPILYMIFNNIREIGSLVHSNVSDDDIFAADGNRPISSCVLLLDTDLEACELYPCFEMMYVDRVSIVDLSEGMLADQSVSAEKESLAFFETFFAEYRKLHAILFEDQNMDAGGLRELIRDQSDLIRKAMAAVPDHAVLREIRRFYDVCPFLLAGKAKLGRELTTVLRDECMRLFDAVYGCVRGRLLFKVVKAGGSGDRRFMKQLNETVERMDRTRIRKLFLDVGSLPSLDGHELVNLIELQRRLRGQGIPLGIIVGSPMNKRIVNLFDSIKTVEHFALFATERDAVLGD